MDNAGVKQEQAATEQAVKIVRRFLQALEAGDLDGADALLGPEALMVFPGGRRFTCIAELGRVLIKGALIV